MPAKWFKCPNGEIVGINECLQYCTNRCLSKRTLRAIAEQREWKGVPSTTQLLKGTREAYLEITTDYAIDPQDALFRVHGSKAHAYLDQFVGADELGEERLFDEICSGQFDFYDSEEQAIYDTKTSGSYKIMKALGIYTVDAPEIGEDGEPVRYKSGQKKGEVKTKKELQYNGNRDRLDWAIQLNDYRIKLEQVFPVKKMIIEALVRDGNTYMATGRGITQNGYLIEINRISDHWIRKYLAAKRDALMWALEWGETPALCRLRETWHGRKCDGYCNVAQECEKRKTLEGGCYDASTKGGQEEKAS